MLSFGENNKLKENLAFSRSWVRLNLGLKGFTFQSFAEKHGVKPGTVGVVFSRPYPRMERLIADTLGIDPWTIWPERYDSAGRSNRPNLWYLRKSGGWKPKISGKGRLSQGKDLNEDIEGLDVKEKKNSESPV